VFSNRPATVLQEFNLEHFEKTHDLSDFADVRRQILGLLGIRAEHEDVTLTEGAGI
jgi:NitT/TauT family transport system ATP-binding protein